MKGWILYVGAPTRELERGAQEAKAVGVHLEVVSPKEISLMVNPAAPGKVCRCGQWVDAPDFAMAAFVEEPDYYNLAVLRQLEVQGVVCVNRAETLERTGDKLRTMQLLAPHGIPMPKTMLLHPNMAPDFIIEELGLPVVLKVLDGCKGKGVALVHARKELDTLLHMWHASHHPQELLAQQFIAESKGRDLRVLVIDHKPVVGMQRMSRDAEGFKSNFSAGGAVEAYPLTDDIRALAQQVIDILGLCIGGIDLLFSNAHGHVVCEVNSVPGFQGIESCCDINVPVEVLQCVARKVMEKRAAGRP